MIKMGAVIPPCRQYPETLLRKMNDICRKNGVVIHSTTKKR